MGWAEILAEEPVVALIFCAALGVAVGGGGVLCCLALKDLLELLRKKKP